MFRLILFTCLFGFLQLEAQVDKDLEVTGIAGFGDYIAESGLFSDAHYVMTDLSEVFDIEFFNKGQSDLTNHEIRIRFYIENPQGLFEEMVYEFTTTLDIGTSEGVLLMKSLADFEGFNPQTYKELNESGFNYPIASHFTTMERNVTPRYKIIITCEEDDNPDNNTFERIYRFFLKKSELNILASVENSFADISASNDSDMIAGKLNVDSLKSALKNSDITNSFRNEYDLLDRNGWEQNAVYYTLYEKVFWVDGDDKPLNTTEKNNLNTFLESSGAYDATNLAILSQELARELSKDNEYKDSEFLNEMLHTQHIEPGNPLGEGGNNTGNNITCLYRCEGEQYNIIETGVENDPAPFCGLISADMMGQGLTRRIFEYENHSANETENTMGILNVSLTYLVSVLATDIRHIENNSSIVREIFDAMSINKVYQLNAQSHYFDVDFEKYTEFQPGEEVTIPLIYGNNTETGPPELKIYNYLDNSVSDSKPAEYTFTVPETLEPGQYEIIFDYIETSWEGGASDEEPYYWNWKKLYLNIVEKTDVKENTGNEFNIYPNPADDMINIVMPDAADYTLKIYNSIGIEVFANKFNTATIRVNTESFAPGLYYIDIQGNGSLIRDKIIIQ